MKSRTEILVPFAAIRTVPIAVIAWYRLHRYAWYRYSAIVNNFGGGLKFYKYEVKKLFIFDEALSFEGIKAIGFKSSILDQWAANIMETGFKEFENEINDPKLNIIYYYPPQPYTLLKSEDVNIDIYFCFRRTVGGISQGVTQQAYLRLHLRKNQSFNESLETMQKYCFLLFLLTNRTFMPENITCYSKGKFVYKVNEKYGRNRQTLWGGCADANPKLSTNDT